MSTLYLTQIVVSPRIQTKTNKISTEKQEDYCSNTSTKY